MNTPPRFLLRIPDLLYEEMLAQASNELPNECCGLLAGRISKDGTTAEVSARFALVNELASPTEFVSEPRSMFATIKKIREDRIDVLAVYHSHPMSAPIPSRTDLARNYSSAVMNLIIGFGTAKPEVRGWWLSECEFHSGNFEVICDPETPVGVEPT